MSVDPRRRGRGVGPGRGRAGRGWGGQSRGGLAAGVLLLLGLVLLTARCRCDGPQPERVLHPFPERYAGVGVELRTKSDWPLVVRVIPGSAAARAGIRPGDVILEVDGVTCRGWTLADTVAALRGKRGTRVVLTLRRGAGPQAVIGLLRGTLARPPSADGGLDSRGYRPMP